jgi:MFS family permease
MLIVGRFIAGISIGVLSMIVPVYQAEISPPVSCCPQPEGKQR